MAIAGTDAIELLADQHRRVDLSGAKQARSS
jgi:hypothetical protein